MNKTFVPNSNHELSRDKQVHQHMPQMGARPMKLARAYVVPQPYTGLFSLEVALKVGTVFPNLFEAFPEIR